MLLGKRFSAFAELLNGRGFGDSAILFDTMDSISETLITSTFTSSKSCLSLFVEMMMLWAQSTRRLPVHKNLNTTSGYPWDICCTSALSLAQKSCHTRLAIAKALGLANTTKKLNHGETLTG